MVDLRHQPCPRSAEGAAVTRLRVSARTDKRMDEILALAATQGIPVERVDAQALDRAARGGVHQGVVAEIEDARDYSIAELASILRWLAPRCQPPPLIVVLDGIEDPHNVGAILRTVRCGGRDRRHPADAAFGGARRRRRQGVGRRARARPDRDGREHRARGRGAEGRAGLDDRARRATRRSPTPTWTGRCRRRWSWARRGRGCAGWSGSAAIGWSGCRCGGRLTA